MIGGFQKSLFYRTIDRVAYVWRECRWYRLTVTVDTHCDVTKQNLDGWEGRSIRHCKELDVRVELLNRSIGDTFEKACLLVRNKGTRCGPRWTKQLEHKKREVRRLFLMATRLAREEDWHD